MDTQITNHAKTRFQQRGIKGKIIDYLMEHGDKEYAPGGAMKITMKKRAASNRIYELKKEINIIENAKNLIIIQKGHSVITSYHK